MSEPSPKSDLRLFVAIGLLRATAMGLGLLILIPAVIEWTGAFPSLTATLNSGEAEYKGPVAEGLAKFGFQGALPILLIAPYRKIGRWWLRAGFGVGLLVAGVWFATGIPEAIAGARAGQKAPELVPAAVMLTLIPIGSLWALWVITSGRYVSIFTPPTQPLQPASGGPRTG